MMYYINMSAISFISSYKNPILHNLQTSTSAALKLWVFGVLVRAGYIWKY